MDLSEPILINLELGALAIGMGIRLNSWRFFGGMMVIGYVVQSVKALAIPMSLILSVAWGGGLLGRKYVSKDRCPIGIVGVIALGLHGAGLNYNGLIE